MKNGKKRFFSLEDLQVIWVKAELWRQQEYGRSNIADQMRSVIKNGKVDKKSFRELVISPSWEPGTVHFVDHSPEEGFWKLDQLELIFEAERYLAPWLFYTCDKYLYPPMFSKEGTTFYFSDIFNNCPVHKSMVKFE